MYFVVWSFCGDCFGPSEVSGFRAKFRNSVLIEVKVQLNNTLN